MPFGRRTQYGLPKVQHAPNTRAAAIGKMHICFILVIQNELSRESTLTVIMSYIS